jgi:hypothetical protein
MRMRLCIQNKPFCSGRKTTFSPSRTITFCSKWFGKHACSILDTYPTRVKLLNVGDESKAVALNAPCARTKFRPLKQGCSSELNRRLYTEAQPWTFEEVPEFFVRFFFFLLKKKLWQQVLVRRESMMSFTTDCMLKSPRGTNSAKAVLPTGFNAATPALVRRF